MADTFGATAQEARGASRETLANQTLQQLLDWLKQGKFPSRQQTAFPKRADRTLRNQPYGHSGSTADDGRAQPDRNSARLGLLCQKSLA